MKRPVQHITNTKGETLLRSVLESSGWAISSVSEDYGIDYLVEIFHENESTGVFFKVQLKSSEKTGYSAQNTFISQQIKIESVDYLCREVRTPVILVHADVSHQAVFWTAPQLDLETLERLREQSEEGTITLRIPASNSLPKTITQLAEAVNQVETVLASRIIVGVPISDFLSDVEGHIDADEFIREVQDKSAALRIQQATKLFQAGKFEEVEELVNKVLKNEEASVQSKFWALLIAEKNELLSQARSGAPQASLKETGVRRSKQLQILTKNGPSHLKFFALISRKAADLADLAFQDLGLFMAWESMKQGGSFAHSRTDIVFRRIRVEHKLNLLHRQCVRLVNYAADYRFSPALSVALLRIVEGISIYCLRLEAEGMNDLKEDHLRVGFEICSRARDMASSVNDDYALSEAAGTVMLLAGSSSIDVAQWAEETIAEIENEDFREDALARFERHLQRIKGQSVEGDPYGKATEEQVQQNIKSALEADPLG